MKAFSRIPDPFQYQDQTANFKLPNETLIKVQAIPQGKQRKIHLISTSNHQKYPKVSLEIDQIKLHQISKDNEKILIKQLNSVSKEFETQQKLNTVKNAVQAQERTIDALFLSSEVNFQISKSMANEKSLSNNPKLKEKQHKENVHSSQKSQQMNLEIQSYVKPELSHIIFSSQKQSFLSAKAHKKPIFQKMVPISSPESQFEKFVISQSPIQQKKSRISSNKNENLNGFAIPKYSQSQVQNHIQCSFFGNNALKNDVQALKKTGINLNSSLDPMFEIQVIEQNATTQKDKRIKQQQKMDSQQSYHHNKAKIKKLGGPKRLLQPKFEQKKSVQRVKLELTRIFSIDPVYF